jgi:hypothetical protein
MCLRAKRGIVSARVISSPVSGGKASKSPVFCDVRFPGVDSSNILVNLEMGNCNDIHHDNDKAGSFDGADVAMGDSPLQIRAFPRTDTSPT